MLPAALVDALPVALAVRLPVLPLGMAREVGQGGAREDLVALVRTATVVRGRVRPAATHDHLRLVGLGRALLEALVPAANDLAMDDHVDRERRLDFGQRRPRRDAKHRVPPRRVMVLPLIGGERVVVLHELMLILSILGAALVQAVSDAISRSLVGHHVHRS